MDWSDRFCRMVAIRWLAAAMVCVCLPVTIQAMPYSQLIIFGDSLSDSGQLPDTSSAFSNSAFSSAWRSTNRKGPTYQDDSGEPYAAVLTQHLAERLGLEALPSTPALQGNLPAGTNYAVSGYRTDQVLDSIITESQTIIPPGYSGAGLLLARRPGYLSEFPHADPDALYYLNGGGNDVFQGIITDQASAEAAARYLVSGVAALQDAGARVIIVSDLPDIGMTPEGIITGQRGRLSDASDLFNRELDRQLSELGGNVIRLNSRGLISEIQDNLEAFGFDPSITQTDYCFSDCVSQEHPFWGISGTSPDPGRLLFSDSVHPTTSVHQISGDYIYSIVSAPWEITLLPEMAMSSLLNFQDQLQAPAVQSEAVGQWRSFFSISGIRDEFRNRAAVAEGDSDGLGLTLGGSFRPDRDWHLCLGLGFQTRELNADSGSEYEMDSYLFGGSVRYQRERLWLNGGLSLGYLDYPDLMRALVLGKTRRMEKGASDGRLYGLSGRLGYHLADSSNRWQVSPFFSADVVRIEVDGYQEQSTRTTSMIFQDQRRISRRLGIGLQLSCQLTAATRIFGEMAQEKEFEDDPQSLDMGLSSVSHNRFHLQGFIPSNALTLASLGITHRLHRQLDVSAGYHYRRSDDRQHGLNLMLTWNW